MLVPAAAVQVIPSVNEQPLASTGADPEFWSSMNSKSPAVRNGSLAISAVLGSVGW
jgi:hypothetical protein